LELVPVSQKVLIPSLANDLITCDLHNRAIAVIMSSIIHAPPDYGNTYSRLEFLRGHLTNDLVYSRLAPGVLDELRRITPKNEKGRRKGTFSQRLTPDIGVPRLREHVKAVTVLMKASDDWENFMPMLDRSLPRQVELPLFDGKEEKPPLRIGG
jgi:hypothetical protein